RRARGIEQRKNYLYPKLVRFTHPQIQPKFGERDSQRIFRVTESASSTRVIGSRNYSAVKKCVARFDFPVEQSIPAKGMFESNKKEYRNLNRNDCSKNPLDKILRCREVGPRSRFLLFSPPEDRQGQTRDRDDSLQDQTRTKRSANPQE